MAKSNNTNTNLQSSNKNKGSAAEAEEVTVARPETEAESRRAGKEEERDDEGDVTISEIVNGTLEKRKKKKKKRRSEKGDKGCDCKFPMNRIRRIIKSEGSAVHIAQDSVFLINKALEKFLELFCKEAYACATLDKKKHVEYKHLSSVVGKRKRFDFLSDFVPEKVKARDALAEMSSAET